MNCSSALEKTIKNENLQNVVEGLGEFLIDSNLNEGLLKEIPILSTIVGVAKSGISVADRLFLKKLVFFLNEVKDIPKDTREKMINNIDKSEKFKIKVGEKLMYIIDKCEDHEKSRLIAILFKSFINGGLDYDDFLKSSKVIENATVEDLMWFVKNDWERLTIEEAAEYINWGLFEISPIKIKIKDQEDRMGGIEFKVDGDELTAKITLVGSKIRNILKMN